MKKLLTWIIAATMIAMVACITVPTAPAKPMSDSPLVQDISDKLEPDMSVVDYRDIKGALFIWIDDKDVEGDCDLFVLFEKHPTRTNPKTGFKMMRPLVVRGPKNSETPCEDGYQIYGQYLNHMQKNPAKKGNSLNG